MRFLCCGLMSAPPERPCDDIGGLNACIAWMVSITVVVFAESFSYVSHLTSRLGSFCRSRSKKMCRLNGKILFLMAPHIPNLFRVAPETCDDACTSYRSKCL